MPRRRPPPGPFAGQQFKRWQKLYDTPELRRQAENLPARRDMVTVLTYVRDNKVVGTQSTGNMLVEKAGGQWLIEIRKTSR